MLNQPSHRRINPTWCWCILLFYILAPFSLLIKKKIFIFLAMWLMGSWFPNQGWNPCPWQWKYGVLTTGPLGKSLACCYFEDFCACVHEGYWWVGVGVWVCGGVWVCVCGGCVCVHAQLLRTSVPVSMRDIDVCVCVCVCVCLYTLSCSVVSDSLRPHGL